MKVCYLAQFRHLGFHAELTVKHHSNVASEGSRLEDAVTDDEDTHSGDADDDDLYKVMTIMPQYHPDLGHESIANTPPTAEIAGERDQMTLLSQMHNLIQVS